MEHGDFIEGIRAKIIDRDDTPMWRHASWRDVKMAEVAAMMQPLRDTGLTFEGGQT
ncbi:MAG: hypothetical protein GKR99_11455 [Rhodobacteraceae bacterium]|nr:hypothetical protein [Paracoccaceae bacterium]